MQKDEKGVKMDVTVWPKYISKSSLIRTFLYLFQGDLCLAHLRNKHTAAKDQRTKAKLGILSSARPGST